MQALWMLAASFLFATMAVCVKLASTSFNAAELVFHRALGMSPWDWKRAAWLLPVGVLASLAQLCMMRAYGHGATLVVANLQYSGILFGGLYSLLLFGDDIPLVGWAGMALIVASGIEATVLRARAAPDAPAEEH